ncbi:MAG: SusC/RagA family TonB-linked outer membrane protein [Lacibacter sp.]
MTKMNIHKLAKGFVLVLALITYSGVLAQKSKTAPADSLVKRVTGIVKDDATGKGLAGISVSVRDFSAAITDDDGKFTLKVPSYDADVVITGEGFDTKQVSLKGRNQFTVSLLYESNTSFQESVILPTGKMQKRNLTGSVTGVNVNSSWKRPLETVDGLLQGQVPGLNVIRRSGAPGAGANLFLRGYNSLYATNAPLIVVDGMIYDAKDYGTSLIANNYTNPLSLIHVSDIDNITVVKDAASIYGTKGANGAIIITTSRAEKQATSIDFGVYAGINQRPDFLPVMNAADYRVYLGEILQSKGLSASQITSLPYMNDDTTGNNDYYRYHNNTNWQDKVFQNSINTNYFLKVTGGDNIATYALSVGYTKNNGVVKGTDLSRYNTRFNALFNFTKKFTGVGNLAFTYNEQKLKYQGIADKFAPVYLALTKSPFLTSHEVNSKGVFSPNFEDTDILGISNPSALIENMQASNRYYRFFGSYQFKYEINRNLNVSTMFGILFDKVRENIFIPRKGVANDTLSNAIADSRLGNQVKRLFTLYSDSRIEYKKTFKRNHTFESRLGLRYQQNKAEQDFALGYNSATDDLVSVQNGVTALRTTGGGIGQWNWLNTYFSADYGYKDKLFVTVNAAMDGSSRFGQQAKSGISINGNQFAVMPSVGAAWLLSSEKFMKESKIDLLKVRVNYSIAGNDDIGNYNNRQTYTSQNLLGMQGLVRNGISNPAIQWETVKKINFGADIAFWNERFTVSMDVFRSKTTNMLVYENLITATGFNTALTNSGSLKNTGVEASVQVRLINSAKWKWDAGVNIATVDTRIGNVPNNKIVTQYAGADILSYTGSRAGIFYGYIAQGVFSTVGQAGGLKKKNTDGSYSYFGAGDVHFADLNGDLIIDENDMQVIGVSTPDFFGSFSTTLTYKRIQLDALFTFSQGNDVFNYQRYRLESASGVENQLNSVRNRWRTDGQAATMPKATYGDPMGNNRFSTRWIEDGSYIRLRTLSLSYNIPFKDKFLKNASVYVTGNNLLTFTKYMGFDPEFSAGTSMFNQGIDTGLDPLFKSVLAGIRFGL